MNIKVNAARGYWADDINSENNAKILQSLMDSLYSDMDGQKVNNVDIRIGDRKDGKIFKTTNGGYRFNIGFFPDDYEQEMNLGVISSPDSRGKFYCELTGSSGGRFNPIDSFYIQMSGSRQKLKDKIIEIAENISGRVESSMRIKKSSIKADTLSDGRQVSEGSLHLDVIEKKLSEMIGKPVKDAANFLYRYGFDNTELNGADGTRKTTGIDSYDTWAGYENNDGYYVKLYYTMERDRKRGGNAFAWGILTDFYVDRYDVEASTRTRKTPIKADAADVYENGEFEQYCVYDADTLEIIDVLEDKDSAIARADEYRRNHPRAYVAIDYQIVDENGELLNDDDNSVIYAPDPVESSTRIRKTPVRAAAYDHNPWEQIELSKPAFIAQWQSESEGEPDTSWDNIFENALEDFKLYADDEASGNILDDFIDGDLDEIDMVNEFEQFIMWKDLAEYDF